MIPFSSLCDACHTLSVERHLGFEVFFSKLTMAKEGYVISNNEREFILGALSSDIRIDGRRPFDFRKVIIEFGQDDGSVEVWIGRSRVMAVIKAELVAPFSGRPNEGSLFVNTEFSPMADPSFEVGRGSGIAAVELGRIVDRGLRESRAIDVEALCVVAGRYVWSLRINCHILDNDGNIIDAANLAALAALMSFRRPECTVGGEGGNEVVVFPPEEREPLPLGIHHLPVAITFAFFNEGESVVVDPSFKEEEVMGGRLTLTLNTFGEICAIQKGGGEGVREGEILRCLRIAKAKVVELTKILKEKAVAHEKYRQDRKIKRHIGIDRKSVV